MQKTLSFSQQTTSAQDLINFQEESNEAYNYLKNIDYTSQIEYYTKLMQSHIKNKSNSYQKESEPGRFKYNDLGDLADFSFSAFGNINELILENADFEQESFFNRKEIENFAKENNENYILKLKENAIKDNKLIKKQEKRKGIEKNKEENNHKEHIDKVTKSNEAAGKVKPESKIDSSNKTNEKSKVSNSDKLEKILIKNSEVAKIDNQMEDELNNEIFNYTKNMKKYATSFNDVLSKDNRTLNKIENTQIDGKKKTETQLKKLNEFNYDLKIGFFRLIFMFLFVFISFVLSLLMIRIFPKIA